MNPPGGVDWSKLPLGPGVALATSHACGLAALIKPAGVLSHPNREGEEARSLLAARYDAQRQCYSWLDAAGERRRVWLLHRLDSATSGLILVAATEGVANAVLDAFEHRQVHKRYVALVFGHWREKAGVWVDAMEVKRVDGQVRASGGRSLRAETAVRRLKLLPGPPALTLLELEPRTGRTHQLRHQCSKRRLPIVGDQTYGNFRTNREWARRAGTDRLYLHARSVDLEVVVGTQKVRFAAEAPLPSEFGAV